MKYLLYTTSSSSWYQKQCDIIAKEWSRIKGAEPVSIEVRTGIKPYNVREHIVLDKDGHFKFGWEWFERTFDHPDYDGVFFHFTPYYKRKWGISEEINGAKMTSRKDKPLFWLCANKGEWAKDYAMLYEFDRLMYHEMAHFYEDLDDNLGNKLQQESVHITDYKLHKIHYYHLFIDLRGLELRRKVDRLIIKIINFVNKHI